MKGQINLNLKTTIVFKHYHWAVYYLMLNGHRRITQTMVIGFLKDQIQKFGTCEDTLMGAEYCSQELSEYGVKTYNQALEWALPRWEKMIERRSV